MQDIGEAKTWLSPLFPVLSLEQRCIKVFSLDTPVNKKSSKQNIPCSLVYFQDIQSRKVSSSVSRVKSFWGQQGQAGRQGGQGFFFWWTCSLTVELTLEYSFPPIADCQSDWKSSARASSACVTWCFLQSCTLSSVFPLAIFPVNLFFLRFFN